MLQAEAALRQAQKMEAIGQLTGGIAHDFNNLLQVIVGNLELLQRELPERRRGRAAAAQRRRSAPSAARASPHSCSPSRAASRWSRTSINLDRLVREHDGPAAAHARRAASTIETVVAGGLWNTLVDPDQLENAILNLAINARDAMPEGGKLTIEVGERHPRRRLLPRSMPR